MPVFFSEWSTSDINYIEFAYRRANWSCNQLSWLTQTN